MTEDRTSPADALELLAWHLNYFPGQPLSMNELANATGLAWATVRKYAQLLETLEKITPEVRILKGKAQVEDRNRIMTELFRRPLPAAALYLLIHGRAKGDPLGPFSLPEHPAFASQFSETLQRLVKLGLAQAQGDVIRLTPAGATLAEDARNEILTAPVPYVQPVASQKWTYMAEETDKLRARGLMPAGSVVQLE
jgi:hypothetical protein